ncbi:M1 family metallopeptidase [Thermoflexibacter ruber]|uniref:Aminopeptidase N n=1 Tax=Thermoflexibacter ruber TaxID=1003 RepID=A0A1I2FLP1_9BACT|nr:M1 family metallopeptidase [Thermoflexibacter ruber]SFF05426.1 aminopeptidase N [Thermoflexibacter ruber]
MRYYLLFAVFSFLSQSLFAQENPLSFTHQDSLRGTLFPERACYDVTFYDLNLKIHPESQTIKGYNEIHYKASQDFQVLQIDLFENLQIDRILQGSNLLKFKREGNATFVYFPEKQKQGSTNSIKVYYQGKPQIARRPPWEGGLTWTKDKEGNDWIAVSCEGLGASVWFPNKDHLSDEPDSIRLYFEVPKGLMCVANGNLISQKAVNNLYDSYEWKVSYPINNYNITFVVGKLAHFQDTYESKDKEKLALDYYVLAYNLEKAKTHFQQVKKMLACYEEKFGKYPFWKDGYALVETPFWGMEHQGAIAYGNNYINNELGFDFIIVHESGHEYFGNSISVGDHAEMWIHEGFTTYSDALFVECLTGSYDQYVAYLKKFKDKIQNLDPVLAPLGVNYRYWRGSDMYYKGAWMLHTLRSLLANDALWFKTLYDFHQTFKLSIVNSEQVIDFFCAKLGKQYRPILNQYLKYAKPPILKIYKRQKGKRLELHYKLEAQEPNFELPIRLKISDSKEKLPSLKPQKDWQKIKLKLNKNQSVDFEQDLYYFLIEDTST